MCLLNLIKELFNTRHCETPKAIRIDKVFYKNKVNYSNITVILYKMVKEVKTLNSNVWSFWPSISVLVCSTISVHFKDLLALFRAKGCFYISSIVTMQRCLSIIEWSLPNEWLEDDVTAWHFKYWAWDFKLRVSNTQRPARALTPRQANKHDLGWGKVWGGWGGDAQCIIWVQVS